MLYTLFLSTILVAIATHSHAHVLLGGKTGVLTLDRTLSNITLEQSPSLAESTGAGSNSSLQIKITNTASAEVYAYIMGNDFSNGKAVVYQNGANGWYYPTEPGVLDTIANNLTIEIAANGENKVTLTEPINSGRVYIGSERMTFMAGESGTPLTPSPVDKNDANYGFAWAIAELTWSDGQLTTDLSYVDSVGLALGIKVTTADGKELYDPGLPPGSLDKICHELATVSDDWGALCIRDGDGNLIRALAPSKYLNGNTPGSLNTTFDSYIDDVWKRYSTAQLTINTQQSEWGPNVTCRCGETTMVCAQPDGKTYNYVKPTTLDIFGCGSGPFASSADGNELQARTWPRLCAAFTRSTLLLDGGDVTPSFLVGADRYYTVEATNHFARIVHKFATPGNVGSGAYAFAFDDVNAPGTGENESGMFQVGDARSMEIEVRGT
jgi:hypothetical protein